MKSERRPALLIAESRDFCPQAAALLGAHFELELADLDRAELLRRVPPFEYLWVRLRTLIDSEILDAAPRLKAIITNTTGLNHIDLEAAARRGIEVLSLRGETEFLRTIRATAEHTIGLTLALLRKIPAAHADVCRGHWERDRFRGREIYGTAVGIVGYGRLGQMVAKTFDALGANVRVHDRVLSPGEVIDGFTACDLRSLCASADIVSLHLSYEPGNRHFFGAAELGGMKSGAILVNTARGELLDERALLEALRSGRLAGAALDVLDAELGQSPTREELREFAATTDRLVLTPHLGGNTIESRSRTELFLSEKLIRALNARGGA